MELSDITEDIITDIFANILKVGDEVIAFDYSYSKDAVFPLTPAVTISKITKRTVHLVWRGDGKFYGKVPIKNHMVDVLQDKYFMKLVDKYGSGVLKIINILHLKDKN